MTMALTAVAARRPVFGFTPTLARADDVADTILGGTDRVRLVVTPNLDHVARLRRSAAFRDAYRSADIVLCDGFPVHVYARWHAHRTARVTGCDVLASVMRRDRRYDDATRLFFAVDSDETAAAVADWAMRRGLADRVATAVPAHGFARDPQAAAALAAAIGAHATTLLVMAVGAPQSEIFVDRARSLLPHAWAICVGQAVRVELGLTRRAPAIARRAGLEWLWRFAQEPKRLGRRYALGSLDFLLAVTEDMLDQGHALLGPEL